MKPEHNTEDAEAIAAFKDDPFEVVRCLAGVAAQRRQMTAEQRRSEPDPLTDWSPIVQAARRICVLRGYAENGNELPGFMERAARAALASATPGRMTAERIESIMLKSFPKTKPTPAYHAFAHDIAREVLEDKPIVDYELMYNTMLNRAKDAGFQSISDAIRAAAEAKPPKSACEHRNTDAHYTHVQCRDCGHIKTDTDWGIASQKWFESEVAAKFYKQHGRLPDPVA